MEIVKAAIGDKGGVRMTGGGFGGCVVALIPEELVDTVQQAVANEYEAKTGIKGDILCLQTVTGGWPMLTQTTAAGPGRSAMAAGDPAQ